MCLQNMREAAFKMIRFAKERGYTVIVSSSDSTDRYEMYLNEGADFILLGEAEFTLLELANTLNREGTDFYGIEGLAFKVEQIGSKDKTTECYKRPGFSSFPCMGLCGYETLS